MIEHLTNERIDSHEWDAMLDASSEPLWYARAHVLDAAAPGWEALMDRDTGAIMPLTWKTRWRVPYLFQPFAIQQLGVFAPRPDPALVQRSLQAVPARFRHADIYLNQSGPLAVKGWTFTTCTDHLVRLDRPLEEVRSGYSTNHRRSLGRSRDAIGDIDTEVPVEELCAMMAGSPQFRRWGIRPGQMNTLRRIMATAVERDPVSSWGVRKEGRLIAGAFFVHDRGRTIFLKGLALQEGRARHGMHHLIDRMVQARCGVDRWLDLAGGNTPDLARFYAGFGAEPSLYLRAVLHRSTGWKWVTALRRYGR
ncbi:MAG: hypothetical protein H6595_01120 [Flavobacteriales bacterium]|nr:hypothetical protein [Flavobacteriales bacterium]MCB9166059.1 hypothetical protein [Flavobacteriales bacterium]